MAVFQDIAITERGRRICVVGADAEAVSRLSLHASPSRSLTPSTLTSTASLPVILTFWVATDARIVRALRQEQEAERYRHRVLAGTTPKLSLVCWGE